MKWRPLLDELWMVNIRDGLVILGLAVGEEGRGEDAPEGVDQGDGQEDDEQKSVILILLLVFITGNSNIKCKRDRCTVGWVDIGTST
jgi:hypothetical protein